MYLALNIFQTVFINFLPYFSWQLDVKNTIIIPVIEKRKPRSGRVRQLPQDDTSGEVRVWTWTIRLQTWDFPLQCNCTLLLGERIHITQQGNTVGSKFHDGSRKKSVRWQCSFRCILQGTGKKMMEKKKKKKKRKVISFGMVNGTLSGLIFLST